MMNTSHTAEASKLDLLPGLSPQIRLVAPASLAAFGRRARTHSKEQIAQIVRSIETFGFSVPVLVDEHDKVIAGNARIEAAIQLGLAEIPVVTLSHLDAAQKRAFVLAENKLASLAGWDKAVLTLEFKDLVELDLDFDLDVTGFAAPEIDALVFGQDEIRPSVTEIKPATATSRVGDLWLLDRHRLMCGDSTNKEAVAQLLGGEQVRTIFEDCPYNVNIRGHVSGSGKHQEFVMASGEMSDDEFTNFLTKVLARTAESLVPGGLAYVCMDFRHMRNVLDAADKHPLKLLNLIVWDKGQGGMGSFYRSRHELIFLFAREGGAHMNRVQLGKHGRDRCNVWSYRGMHGTGDEQKRARELHPTVKPLALVKDAILDSTNRGDLVLDLFSGSGTTILAAHDTGRRGAAMELDPVYADTTILRWQEHSGKEAVLAFSGKTFREVRAERGADVPSAGSTSDDVAVSPPPARARTRRAA
ncbi:DNA methyltransferase [uncultured Sphingomonas sp.]|uniref:site-specific DNA-methyltransferase n=1 Tax=uncultured Sphingomonas sp. TaxID=158754 RepID=UPI002624E62A|nr:DNA methyltransferase [uncultured Sphingomonas sp.]